MPISSFTKAYHSYSGVDITAVVGTQTFGTLQGISYQISREKAPLYVMGSVDPVSFSRGKRAIAGSLVFMQFDEEPIMAFFKDRQKFLGDRAEVYPEWVAAGAGEIPPSVLTTPSGPAAVANPFDNPENVNSLEEMYLPANAWYADQILPFDIILSAANEYGYMAYMKVLGVELMNQGNGVSIDDINMEHSYTYIAKGILPWMSASRHSQMTQSIV